MIGDKGRVICADFSVPGSLDPHGTLERVKRVGHLIDVLEELECAGTSVDAVGQDPALAAHLSQW